MFKNTILILLIITCCFEGYCQKKNQDSIADWAFGLDGHYSFSGVKTGVSASYRKEFWFVKIGMLNNISVFSLNNQLVPGTLLSIGYIHRQYKINDRLENCKVYHSLSLEHIWIPIPDHFHSQDLNLVFNFHFQKSKFDLNAGFGMGGWIQSYSHNQSNSTDIILQPTFNAGVAYVW